MRKPNLGKLKGALAALRGMFPMNPAKRELAEIKRHRDLVPLNVEERHKRELLLQGALDTGSMVALAGTENRIAQMVAEQTRGFRAQINEMHGHVSALSQRIGQLENPNQPKFGEIGSGTGVFPRARTRKSAKSEIAGRPGRLKDAVAEGVAGEMARRDTPTKRRLIEAADAMSRSPQLTVEEVRDAKRHLSAHETKSEFIELQPLPREDRADLRRGDRYGGMDEAAAIPDKVWDDLKPCCEGPLPPRA